MSSHSEMRSVSGSKRLSNGLCCDQTQIRLGCRQGSLLPLTIAMTPLANLFTNLPSALDGETIEALHVSAHTRIERIVSHAVASPPGFWYDQELPEWVALLRGKATLCFDDGETLELRAGAHLVIAAHRRHRVERTSADALWLAVHG
jgi:cupin 2 domain-containing protein